jgi:hypothetical protein
MIAAVVVVVVLLLAYLGYRGYARQSTNIRSYAVENGVYDNADVDATYETETE